MLAIGIGIGIGIGSSLWHFMPNQFTVLADVIPILLFINICLPSFFHRVFGFKAQGLILIFSLFLLFIFIVSLTFPANLLNGSIFYGPGWLLLIIIGLYLYFTNHALHGRMLVAGGVFTAALLFRTVDRDLCQWIPIGTHFIWHLLNAWLLYLVTSALLRQEAKRHLLKT
ncbi:MAG: hypothetical protein AMJ53_11605 [Gammaproteobacteria bacterium SG8_11]|nr:MAG: hypothetical protein AMJ53_11605 [Gammaproteobacteria bacterium SG8_11]